MAYDHGRLPKEKKEKEINKNNNNNNNNNNNKRNKSKPKTRERKKKKEKKLIYLSIGGKFKTLQCRYFNNFSLSIVSYH
jgi:predicted transcriptional regulator